MLNGLRVVGHHGALPKVPRVFGGFAFAAGRAAKEPWMGFGDARFVLPRLEIRRNSHGGTLSINLLRSDAGACATLLRQALALRAELASLVPARGAEVVVNHRFGVNESEWCASVEQILAQIQAGSFSKVVAALRDELRFQQPIHLAATLTELRRHAASTVFAFKHAGKTFCGASPERLMRKRGVAIESEALAGTFRRDSNYAAELLRSPKEHREHAPVLAAIVACLAPLCERLEQAPQPQIFELPHLLHLRSPVHGELSRPVHILHLLERLHPTPAVGGVPRAAALDFIAAHEPERGWYAGPVGWFDAHGDGEFMVALRSGVLDHRRAFLFAGAGIVLGSEPHTEFAETQLKMRSLRSALRA
jgi:isochorismate synthase